MRRKTALALLAAASAGALALSSCANTSNSAITNPAERTAQGFQVSTTAQPDSKGAALLSVLDNAKQSIDLVVYDFGSYYPTGHADPQITTSLVNAMKRGVNVRLLLDGYSASQVKNNTSGVNAVLAAATAAGITNPPLQAHWSSNNFNITHQKSIIADAQGGNGGTPTLLISTGNFVGDNGFYGSRDLYMTTTNSSLVSQVSTVYNSDFNCDGRTTTNNLLNSNPLVWSNGTTGLNEGDAQNEYPLFAPTTTQPNFGYFDYDEQNSPTDANPPIVQGNSRQAQVDIINNAPAGSIMRIYNEEYSDTQIQSVIINAVNRGVDVRMVQTFESGKKQTNLQRLAAAGGAINIMAPDEVPNSVYIHAKAITVTPQGGAPTVAYVGSSNFTQPSLEDNRELGIVLDSSNVDSMNLINSTFDGDFNLGLPLGYRADKTNGGTTYPQAWNNMTTPDTDSPPMPTKPQGKSGKSTPPPPNVSSCGPITTGAKKK